MKKFFPKRINSAKEHLKAKKKVPGALIKALKNSGYRKKTKKKKEN